MPVERVPSAIFHCQDIRAPFPVERAGVVVASLSLHYFPWPETEALADRIRQLLLPAGVLLCRLNSTNDHHFGASGHPRIDDDYYMVDGEPKRFFDRAATERLFARGWRTLSLEEGVIDRYDHPKVGLGDDPREGRLKRFLSPGFMSITWIEVWPIAALNSAGVPLRKGLLA